MSNAKYDTYKVISFMNEYRKERELGIFHKKFINLFPHVHIWVMITSAC